MSDVKIQSPLVQVSLADLPTAPETLKAEEHAFYGHLNVRGSAENTAFVQVMKSHLGASLPTTPNTLLRSGDLTVLWLGPDEWLVVTAPGQQIALRQSMLADLGDTFAAVTDISGTNTIVKLSGSAARALLAKGCTIDLHPAEFSVDQCAQTAFVKTGVTVYRTENADEFMLIIRRSFADYFGLWLLDAAREFSPQAPQ